MDSRGRLLTALNNEKPDRLPCQVDGWMDYYLKTYLEGIDQYEACSRFGMDKHIYIDPDYIFSDKDKTHWDCQHKELGQDEDGNWQWVEIITTPEGILTTKGARNEFTTWVTEYLIKSGSSPNLSHNLAVLVSTL